MTATPEFDPPSDWDVERETADFMAMKWSAEDYRVSPAPDTEALRAYLRRTIGGDFERRLIAADLLDDDDALSVLRVFEDVVPAIEREITSRHEAFVLMLADAKSERDERIAGLRADLDRARRSEYHGEALLGQQVRRADQLAAENERLRAELARVSDAQPIPDDAAERLAAVRHLHREFRIYGECGHQHKEEGNGVISVENVGLTCADGYEYSICRECCTSGSDYQTEECATNHEGERACWPCSTAKTLGATPTTGPAPAAADGTVTLDDLTRDFNADVDNRVADALTSKYGFLPLDVRYKAASYARKVVRDWIEATRYEPAAPQAPAEPTVCPDCHETAPVHKAWCIKLAKPMTPASDLSSLAAREDTTPPDGRRPGDAFERFTEPVRNDPERQAAIEAFLDEPDDYGDDLGGWARRTPIQPEEA